MSKQPLFVITVWEHQGTTALNLDPNTDELTDRQKHQVSEALVRLLKKFATELDLDITELEPDDRPALEKPLLEMTGQDILELLEKVKQ